MTKSLHYDTAVDISTRCKGLREAIDEAAFDAARLYAQWHIVQAATRGDIYIVVTPVELGLYDEALQKRILPKVEDQLRFEGFSTSKTDGGGLTIAWKEQEDVTD